jgi:hypothetical protein
MNGFVLCHRNIFSHGSPAGYKNISLTPRQRRGSPENGSESSVIPVSFPGRITELTLAGLCQRGML